MKPVPCIFMFGSMAMAGCLGGAEEEEGDGDPAPALVTAERTVDAGLTGCVELGAGRLISFEHARSLLPAGYQPGEAADFLGMPTPTGGGVVLAGQLDCDGSVLDEGPLSWADLIIYVEPPMVPGVDTSTDHVNLYQLAQFTRGEGMLSLLTEYGFEAPRAEVVVDLSVDPLVPVGTASIQDDDGELLRFTVAGTAPQPYELFARFWHETENGTAFFTHDRTPIMMFLGVLTECTARPGSLHAIAFGVTDCTGGDSIGGVFAEASNFDSRFTFLPGTFAEVPEAET